jgi:hypothetical protein
LDILLLNLPEIFAKNNVLYLNDRELSNYKLVLIPLILFSPHSQELSFASLDIKNCNLLRVSCPEISIGDFPLQTVESEFKQLKGIEQEHVFLDLIFKLSLAFDSPKEFAHAVSRPSVLEHLRGDPCLQMFAPLSEVSLGSNILLYDLCHEQVGVSLVILVPSVYLQGLPRLDLPFGVRLSLYHSKKDVSLSKRRHLELPRS